MAKLIWIFGGDTGHIYPPLVDKAIQKEPFGQG